MQEPGEGREQVGMVRELRAISLLDHINTINHSAREGRETNNYLTSIGEFPLPPSPAVPLALPLFFLCFHPSPSPILHSRMRGQGVWTCFTL